MHRPSDQIRPPGEPVEDRPRGGEVAVLDRDGADQGPDGPIAAAGDGHGTEELDAGGGAGPRPFWLRFDRRGGPEAAVTFLVVVTCVVFTFVQLQPSNLFANTTPAGGDMGAHVWLPAYVKAHLLPHFRITGWTPDWYDGFPALTYYFPLPIVAIALVSYVIPYNIAFKLVTVAGLLALPIAAWALGRLARMPFPAPACLASAALVYLFNRDFTIYGGNIASTMAGEFSFSISLALALVFLGLVARGLSTGRSRAIAAVVLACCALSHVLPLFFAVGGAVLMFALRPNRHRVRWLLPVLVVGGLLVAFWALPFEYRLNFATNMGYQKLTTYVSLLFPHQDLWLFIMAGVGALASLARRRRMGTWLLAMTVASALVFRFAPQARLWNARVLPFWFLCLYFLAALAVAEIGTLAAEVVTSRPDLRRSLMPVPVVSLVAALIWVGYPLHILPFGHTVPNAKTQASEYSWLGIHSSAAGSFIPDWVRWNYSGYQSTGKARMTEYFALVKEMAALGQDPNQGCGTAMWEYEPELDQMGTPDALMLLPYWTKGCIGSMEGLYYESSATTPYHFLNVSELSDKPSDPMVGLHYATTPDVALGVRHLQMLGVKYFMALTPDVESQAAANSSLQQVAAVGPFPVSYTSGNQTTVLERTWKIYKVLDSAKVTPLINQPVVMKGVTANEATWLQASEAWYLSPSRWDVYETATGPSSWARVPAGDPQVPRRALPSVQVSAIQETTDTISFDVSQVGVPVVVKTSYFPNWQASGAGTVYRATPNLMIVVPTSHHVVLHYGYTPVDWTGFLLSLLGLVGVAGLLVAGRVRYPNYYRAATATPLTVGGDGWPWGPPDGPPADDLSSGGREP
jgi:hypothetical protein